MVLSTVQHMESKERLDTTLRRGLASQVSGLCFLLGRLLFLTRLVHWDLDS
jgi:hypothetical protein